MCKRCGNIFKNDLLNGNIPRCLICYPYNISNIENKIHVWLSDLKLQNIVQNKRSIIPPLELDIYLPDYRIAIEINGLYWHSELNGKDKHYHIDKTNRCKEKGVQLIHIFEDEWINRQEIVKSIILNKLGMTQHKISARDCVFKELIKKDVYNFLFTNHIQDPIVGKHNYGLFYENELVQLISLSKPRYNKNFDYELIRSCSKLNTVVVGGFNKLIKNLPIQGSLISYVDRRYFTGNSYKDWRYIGETSPNYYYTKGYQRESRIKYQKHKLARLFPDIHDDELTEWQIMQLAGYDRIWDCGNFVYVKE